MHALYRQVEGCISLISLLSCPLLSSRWKKKKSFNKRDGQELFMNQFHIFLSPPVNQAKHSWGPQPLPSIRRCPAQAPVLQEGAHHPPWPLQAQQQHWAKAAVLGLGGVVLWVRGQAEPGFNNNYLQLLYAWTDTNSQKAVWIRFIPQITWKVLLFLF